MKTATLAALLTLAATPVLAQSPDPLCPRGEYRMDGTTIHAKVKLPTAGYTVGFVRKHHAREMPPHLVCIPPKGPAAAVQTTYDASIKVSSTMKRLKDKDGEVAVK